jgi:hypothetical protein
VTAIRGLIGELRCGLARVDSEILVAADVEGDARDAAHARFGEVMVAFQGEARAAFEALEVCLSVRPSLAGRGTRRV